MKPTNDPRARQSPGSGHDAEGFATLEELGPQEYGGVTTVAPDPREQPASADTKALVRDLISSYSIVPIPVAIIDRSLTFLYRNGPFDALMEAFGKGKATLLDAIGRFLDLETAGNLYSSIKDSRKGFSWSGTVALHSKNISGVITKATIVPFKSTSANSDIPAAWVLFLDDITVERNTLIHGLFSSLLEASKLKDNDTGKHIQRVNLYTERLASEMFHLGKWPDVDVDFVESIGFLAAMHDVGKIGTPDDILNKRGPLDEREWSTMKEHTINGAFILSSYPNPMAKQVAQSHHEWWNGSGYPYNLVGEMIPLSARIVAIADVYDALRMKRSYKQPFDHGRASLLIIADGGTHFDPELVEVFKTVGRDMDTIFVSNIDEA
jgi:HD-GYP domain-containing protein (c-di-GMP phosphodiesterase class II)